MKGLYIHIPFCAKKCKYCDFVSYTDREDVFDSYIDALEREAREYAGESIDTIFIGGGTPTYLAARQLERLIKICFNVFDISDKYEFTVEANPGTLDTDKMKAMLHGGVNRVSVGVQSFNDDELRAIGRIHDAKLAYNTICNLNKAGFSNINIDLMTALPRQSRDSLLKTLFTAVQLPVTHISAYSLIIEDGTPFKEEYADGKLILPDEDEDRRMYELTDRYLRKNGFLHYEISNFAKEFCECRHNIKYWECREYIGLGAAAHSYIGDKRYSNTGDLKSYINGCARDVTLLTTRDKISEFMIMGLRMSKGVSESEFRSRFGTDMADMFGKELDKFVTGGFMEQDGERYRLTPRGVDVSNSILCEFV